MKQETLLYIGQKVKYLNASAEIVDISDNGYVFKLGGKLGILGTIKFEDVSSKIVVE